VLAALLGSLVLPSAASAGSEMIDSATVTRGNLGSGSQTLSLPGSTSRELSLIRPLESGAGTLEFWIRPHWAQEDKRSHVFLTATWSGQDQSYLAVSRGWWEPEGAGALYVILSNQDFAFCESFAGARLNWFKQSEWTQIAVTWSAGSPGLLRLFADGIKVCERKTNIPAGRRTGSSLLIGSDEAATDQRHRVADFDLRDLESLPRAASETEIYARYMAQQPGSTDKWLRSLIPAESPAPVLSDLIVFDEDRHWATSRLEAERTVSRLKRAGVSTYVPCVWDGQAALMQSRFLPALPSVQANIKAGRDPLRYLIAAAHREGIRVVLWFDVTRRPVVTLWPQFAAGAPSGAFDIQDAGFRDFISKSISEAYLDYDADGLTLDYIRSMGECQSSECAASYRKFTGRTLSSDWQEVLKGKDVLPLQRWNESAVRSVVAAVAAGVRQRRPGTPIAVAAVPLDHQRLHEGVDAVSWVRDGLVDRVYYMAYGTPIDVDAVSRVWRAIPASQLTVLVQNYRMVGDRPVNHSGFLLVDYARLLSSMWPGSSMGLYHFPHLNESQVEALSGMRSGAQADALTHAKGGIPP
jgi:hypothetical protein